MKLPVDGVVATEDTTLQSPEFLGCLGVPSLSVGASGEPNNNNKYNLMFYFNKFIRELTLEYILTIYPRKRLLKKVHYINRHISIQFNKQSRVTSRKIYLLSNGRSNVKFTIL